MTEASDRWHGPIPRDPHASPCQATYQMPDGRWVTCGEYADETLMDTVMCEEHIDEHYASEQADNDRKRQREG